MEELIPASAQSILNRFEKIFVNSEVTGSNLAERFLKLAPKKVEIVSERPWSETNGVLSPREYERSKKNIYVTKFKGRFFKRCPGAKPGLACCNYYVLNWGLQCDMDCSYCYLQSYINSPVTELYANWTDSLSELKELFKEHADLPLRVGTGEVLDSLSLDPLTLFSHPLIEAFREFPKWTLEFKTKSANVDQFLKQAHAGNVVVSWSINPQNIIKSEEHGTAPLKERLAAARKCLDHGFPIGFHIDPMIWHSDWKENYKCLVDQICERFSPSEVPYVSLGAIRFLPEQRSFMRERFGMESLSLKGEMFPGRDGKLRLHQSVRDEMFRFVIDRFHQLDPRWKVFLCMETPESWMSAYTRPPQKVTELQTLFDSQVPRKIEAR